MEEFPSSLDEFFDLNTEIGVANMLVTAMEHVSMWREEVLFLRQRQQATSDYRENQRVRWMGESLLTCTFFIIATCYIVTSLQCCVGLVISTFMTWRIKTFILTPRRSESRRETSTLKRFSRAGAGAVLSSLMSPPPS